MYRAYLKGIPALLILTSMAGSAMAGGFSRGEADTDLIFEDGAVNSRAGVFFVMPGRKFDTVAGSASTDDAYSDNYMIPSLAAKFRVSDSFSCLGSYTQPFGAASTYGANAQAAEGAKATKSSGFDSNEYGATCAVNFAEGPGNFYLLGGVFVQDFDYTEVTKVGTLNLKDASALGYRVGAAYTIPEYALRGQIMYRSQIEHDVSGAFVTAVPLGPIPAGSSYSTTGNGTMPQSVKISLESGIAPGWLAYGSVKWTDWSVLQSLNYTISGPVGGAKFKDFFWRDGWTLQGGVSHAFSESVGGTVNVTWDRGVGTGADIMTDTWTFGAGTQIKAGPGALKFGGAISYLTAGEKSTAQKATYDATAKGDWAYSVGASYSIKF